MRPVREQISIATGLVALIAFAITVVARRRRNIRAVPTGHRIERTDGNDFQRCEFRDSGGSLASYASPLSSFAMLS